MNSSMIVSQHSKGKNPSLITRCQNINVPTRELSVTRELSEECASFDLLSMHNNKKSKRSNEEEEEIIRINSLTSSRLRHMSPSYKHSDTESSNAKLSLFNVNNNNKKLNSFPSRDLNIRIDKVENCKKVEATVINMLNTKQMTTFKSGEEDLFICENFLIDHLNVASSVGANEADFKRFEGKKIKEHENLGFGSIGNDASASKIKSSNNVSENSEKNEHAKQTSKYSVVNSVDSYKKVRKVTAKGKFGEGNDCNDSLKKNENLHPRISHNACKISPIVENNSSILNTLKLHKTQEKSNKSKGENGDGFNTVSKITSIEKGKHLCKKKSSSGDSSNSSSKNPLYTSHEAGKRDIIDQKPSITTAKDEKKKTVTQSKSIDNLFKTTCTSNESWKEAQPFHKQKSLIKTPYQQSLLSTQECGSSSGELDKEKDSEPQKEMFDNINLNLQNSDAPDIDSVQITAVSAPPHPPPVKLLVCDQCGKTYKQRNSFLKHMWEHSEFWKITAKTHNLSKHNQVQAMQAAMQLMQFATNGQFNWQDSLPEVQFLESRSGQL